ncbi:MAG: hypothetical protein LC772_06985, partial [Chloroflexi bacterium]|nr:hypothetical protein [Chloroflexota bacterium]
MKLKHLPAHHRFWRIELLVLILLMAVFVWQKISPAIENRELQHESLSALIARSRREPNNPQVFYRLGIRLNALGQTGPAGAAFERASVLAPDDENACLAWAASVDAMGHTSKAFYILATFSHAHPRLP